MNKANPKTVYLIGIHVFLLLVLWKSDFIPKVQSKLGFSKAVTAQSPFYDTMVRHHQRMDGSVPENAVIFIGDSMTESLMTSAITELSVNYGIGGDTTAGLLNRLEFYHSIEGAKAVVLAVGVNDFKLEIQQDKILENYKTALEYISARTNVIISAVHPVDENAISLNISNQDIALFNKQLQELPALYQNTYFTDSTRLLIDSNNQLSAQFHVGDGLHLSTSGYQVWINKLKEALNHIDN